jgi:toxin YoeB
VPEKKKARRVRSTKQADLDFKYWQASGNSKVLGRINKLIEACMDDPAKGIGKPEQLRFHAVQTYSRRIDRTHRLVYQVYDDEIVIISARFHYLER